MAFMKLDFFIFQEHITALNPLKTIGEQVSEVSIHY